jgi:2-polyprenyl-6-methoxyphenol hydroxylase-like FAD-dependent oxidoreductase
VGGGVGGTALAVALRQAGIAVDLLELHNEVLGVGVEFSGNAMRALEQMGLLDDFIADGAPYSRMSSYDSAGQHVLDVDFPAAASERYPPCVAIARPKFAVAARRRAAALGTSLRIGITVDEMVNTSNGVEVKLTDGARATYDLVVGADGAMSSIRQKVYGDRFHHKPLGQTCFRCYLPRNPALDHILSYHGRNRITLVPLGPDIMYFPLSIAMDPERRFKDSELAPFVLSQLEEFTAPIFKDIRAAISKDSYIVARAITELLVPSPWHVGRTILIGDAAHCFAPHLGNGAGMVIEDAAVLAEVMAKDGDLDTAFAEFMRRRFDRVKMVWKNANQICRWEVEGEYGKKPYALMAETMTALLEPI